MSLSISPKQIVAESNSPLLAIASGWSRIRLGDIAEVINGFPFPAVGFNSNANGEPVIRIRDVGKTSPSTWYVGPSDGVPRVRHGEIVVGMDGEFRVARWAGQEALLNQRVCTIRVRESAILDERFLFLALPGYLAAINERTSSVTVKHLSSKTILDIPLPLPPMAEQQRIVEIIEEQFSRLDGAVAALEAARRRVEAGISSCFQAHFVDPSKSVQLAHVAEVVGGLAKDSAKQAVDGLVEVPYLRVANVQRGYLDLSDIATIRTTEAKVNNLKLLPGDVLFNEGGDRDKLGRGWVWDGQISICIHQNHVFRARLDTERYLPRFVSHYANTVGRKWFEARGKQTTNLASLNLTTLKSFDLPVLDIEEQRRIVTVVEDTLFIYERLSSALKICEAKQKQLRKAILSSALSGRLMRRFQQPSVPGDARWIAVPQGTAAIEL